MKLFRLFALSACFTILTKDGFTQHQKDGSIVVKTSKTFTIKFPANASTGYTWLLADSLNKKYLVKIGDSYKENPHPAGMVGVPGTQILTFKALRKGTARINLIYMQPWQKQLPPDAERKHYTIKII